MTRVLVTGSRTWPDVSQVERDLWQVWERSVDALTVVHGACRTGVDAMADRWCNRMNDGEIGVLVVVERHPADWQRYGAWAGPRRNAHMVECGADLCLAYIHNHSAGASHCAQLARIAGIRTIIRTIVTEETPSDH